MKDLTVYERACDLHLTNDIGMYYCGKRIKTVQHRYGPQIRNHYLFVLVNSGAAVLHSHADTLFREQDLLIMCPGNSVHYEALTDWSISWIGLYGKTVDDFMGLLGVSGDNPVLHLRAYNEVKELFDKIYALTDTVSYENELRITSLLYEFFSLLFIDQNVPYNSAPIDAAVRIIDYNYDAELNIQKLARELGYDGAYFSRLFKSRMGISPQRYIQNKRMQRAEFLLQNPRITVGEVAHSVGYEDALYFSKIFKKRYGLSPTAYRQKHHTRAKNPRENR